MVFVLVSREIRKVEYSLLTTFYFQELVYRFKNFKIKLRLQLSKNQKQKYLKYGTIPQLPKEKKLLSTFNQTNFKSKKHNKRQKDGWFKIHIENQVYAVQFLNDIFIKKQDYKIIENLLINTLFE